VADFLLVICKYVIELFASYLSVRHYKRKLAIVSELLEHNYKLLYLFQFLPERDHVTLGYTCYRKSVCRLSVCNFRASYSVGENFRQCLYAILYSSHPLTSMLNFMEIVPGKPLRRELNARGVAKYSDVGHFKCYISETVQDTASGTIND